LAEAYFDFAQTPRLIAAVLSDVSVHMRRGHPVTVCDDDQSCTGAPLTW